MTIDEAIEYAKEQQEIFGGKHKEFLTNVAEWLEEFKNIIQWKSDVMEDFCKYDASSINEIVNNARNKAINEFAERLKSDEFQKYNLDMVFETSRDLSYSNCVNAFCEYVDKITEELKAIKSDGFTDDLLNMGYTKGYRKAIDEFAEKLKETLNTYIEDAKDEGDYTYIKPFEISKRAVKEVAEQLKAGGENE